jgi:probable HAF family extracellular repeat protein
VLKRLVAPLVVLAVLLLRPASVCAEYIVTDLGGSGSAYPTGINDAGQVVGHYVSNNREVGFVYSQGSFTTLGPLNDSAFSFATGINASGQVTVVSPGGAYLYNGGHVTGLNMGYASGINDAGQVVGTASPLGGDALLWSGGKTTTLTTAGGPLSFYQIGGINNAGQVVGTSFKDSLTDSRAYFYSGGNVTDLGTLGGKYTWAGAINASGQAVLGSTMPDGRGHAFLYSGGKLTDLGSLGGLYTTASGINNAGQIVGNSGAPFLYSNGKMTDLNSLIPSDSHWSLWDATGINNKGQIVGFGINPAGEGSIFLLTPTAEAPEPGSLTLLALGLLTLTTPMWRRAARPRLAMLSPR